MFQTTHTHRQQIFMFAVMILSLVVLSCKPETKTETTEIPEEPDTNSVFATLQSTVPDYDTKQWKELTEADGYILDIKYATTDNFVKEVIYPCGRFFLRPDVAEALEKVKAEFQSKGLKLKLFDGYRPRPAQQKLWDKVPNPDYVAPPSEGSMHNRGVAVDLTLTDVNGWDIDMGTPYDFFGPKAHHDYMHLSEPILAQRKKLKTVMEAHGFQSIRTEWWHYSYTKSNHPLDDWQWPCKN